jgi:tRNA(fMet)-specific endonuclease VapC
VTYLLDTNACIRLLNGTSPALVARMAGSDPAQIALCSIVKAELLYGARRSSRRADNLHGCSRKPSDRSLPPFDDACAERLRHRRSGSRPRTDRPE